MESKNIPAGPFGTLKYEEFPFLPINLSNAVTSNLKHPQESHQLKCSLQDVVVSSERLPVAFLGKDTLQFDGLQANCVKDLSQALCKTDCKSSLHDASSLMYTNFVAAFDHGFSNKVEGLGFYPTPFKAGMFSRYKDSYMNHLAENCLKTSPGLEKEIAFLKRSDENIGMKCNTSIQNTPWQKIEDPNPQTRFPSYKKPGSFSGIDFETNGGHDGQDLSSNAYSASSQSDWHEDTDELDALLSSDEEEVSTGHSPSIDSLIEGDMKAYLDHNENETEISSRPSRDTINEIRFGVISGGSAIVEESMGETDSNYEELLCNSSCLVRNIQGSSVCSCRSKKLNLQSRSSKISEVNNMAGDGRKKDCISKTRKALKSFSEHSITRKRSMKERVKKMVAVLRSLLFGGVDMDAAIVLNETVQCLKSLQLKVNALELKYAMKITNVGMPAQDCYATKNLA